MRNDIDSKLTHLVRLDLSKSDPWRRARESLKAILSSGSLTAQKHPAVPVASISFSEAPIYQLALGIASNSKPRNRAPYGVMVSKESLFKCGGLPVIYQPRTLAKALPENQQYRHVDFELEQENFIDFSWEREWRIAQDHYPLDPKEVTVIVADRKDYLELEKQLGSQWHYLVLRDLVRLKDPMHIVSKD